MAPTRRLLYLTHRVPFPPDKGDRIRTYHTLRFLAVRLLSLIPPVRRRFPAC